MAAVVDAVAVEVDPSAPSGGLRYEAIVGGLAVILLGLALAIMGRSRRQR